MFIVLDQNSAFRRVLELWLRINLLNSNVIVNMRQMSKRKKEHDKYYLVLHYTAGFNYSTTAVDLALFFLTKV